MNLKKQTFIAFAVVSALTITISSTLMGSPDDRPERCSLATLRGRYLWAASGTLLPPAFGVTQPTPGADAGYNTFNGDGTGTDTVTARIGNTVVVENFVTPIVYTVNRDCTGTYSVPNGPSFGLFIDPGGEEFAAIATQPAGNYPSSIHRRVSSRRQ